MSLTHFFSILTSRYDSLATIAANIITLDFVAEKTTFEKQKSIDTLRVSLTSRFVFNRSGKSLESVDVNLAGKRDPRRLT